MKLIRGLQNLRRVERGLAVTIGAYDGLHLGHQALIRRTQEQAARLGRPAMLLTFEPTPREYFSPDAPVARLTNFRERWRVLERIGGIDYLGLLRFDERLRSMTGEDFARWLAQDLRAARVLVGHDFRFGRGGAATAAMLKEAGARFGFEVDVLEPVTVDGVRVSSSGIREALERGNLAQARAGLGRPYSMIGRVKAGDRLGQELGFPTANLRLNRRRAPLAGIFAVRVRGAAPGLIPGVASLGTRPTVGGTTPLLEAHLFDFAGDLYGREIEVEFVAKLREEQRFASIEAMTAQIRRDAAEAKRILNG